jgi:protein SCO1/2
MRAFVQTFFTFSRTAAAILACASLLEARTFKVDALILRVDMSQRIFVAAHRPIPGYMQAMTMPFRVTDAGQLSGLTPGTRIEFELDRGVAKRIRKVANTDPDLIRPALPVGALLPDFALTDQQGRTVTLRELRGKVAVLQFIYTRCPIAEVCPRLAAGFATLQRRFDDKSLMLLSVSLDPRHDTPAVLADYAKLWRAQPDRWRFLTGSPEAVEQLASNFGVVYWPEDGTLTHTARTAVLDRDGRVAAIVEGSSFRADQLVELVRQHLEVKR